MKCKGGQSNPTYLIESGSNRGVVRKQPTGKLLPSAHAVDRECRVMTALAGADLPVPRTFRLCDEPAVIGTKFYVMEYVEGRQLTETALPGCSRVGRRCIYTHLGEALAALHQVVPDAVGLGDFGRPGNYFARQIHRWSQQFRDSATEPIDSMERLMKWLPDHTPADVQPCIVHGDFRLGDLLLHPSEPRVVAVLDWKLSTLGDGLEDLSYWLQEYHFLEPEGSYTLPGADLDDLGVPSESELMATYRTLTGLPPIENWLFYIAYNMSRSAAIAQGVQASEGWRARQVQGKRSSTANSRATVQIWHGRW